MAITLAEAITQVREKRWYNFDNYDGTGGIYYYRYNGEQSTIALSSFKLCYEWYDGPWSYHTLSKFSEVSAESRARAKSMAEALVTERAGIQIDPPNGASNWNNYMSGFKEIYLDDTYSAQIRSWAGQLAYNVSTIGGYCRPESDIPGSAGWPFWADPETGSRYTRELAMGAYGHMLLRGVITPVAPSSEQLRDDYIYNVVNQLLMVHLDHWIDVQENYTYDDLYLQTIPDTYEYYWPLYFFHTGRALIEYYYNDLDSALDATILAKMQQLLDTWWNRFFIASDVNGWFGLNYQFEPVQGDNEVSPDLSLLWAPLFAWVYYETGDLTAKSRALTLYESGINWAYWDSLGKQYQQQGIFSEQGFTWLAESTPDPPATPDRVRLIVS